MERTALDLLIILRTHVRYNLSQLRQAKSRRQPLNLRTLTINIQQSDYRNRQNGGNRDFHPVTITYRLSIKSDSNLLQFQSSQRRVRRNQYSLSHSPRDRVTDSSSTCPRKPQTFCRNYQIARIRQRRVSKRQTWRSY